MRHAPQNEKWLYQFGIDLDLTVFEFKYLKNALEFEAKEDEDIVAARAQGIEELRLNHIKAYRVLERKEDILKCLQLQNARIIQKIGMRAIKGIRFLKAKVD